MALISSTDIPLGTPAPPFRLPIANPEVDNKPGIERSLHDYQDAQALVIVFTCNHCPYAQFVEDRLINLAQEMAPHGVQFIAINPNDPVAYPADSFEAMQKRAREKQYPFPYLFDESQEVAKAYGAVCTPDFFVFDADRKLVYHGRLDDGRPARKGQKGHPVTRNDLREALQQLLTTGQVTIEQFPSIGCSIKWKPGNEPIGWS